MHLSVRHTFAGDTDAVHAVLTDPAFLDHACRELGAVEYATATTDGVTTIDATLAAPLAARGLLGPRLVSRQEYTWGDPASDGSRTGTVRLTVEGFPLRVAGTTALRPAGDATEFVMDADLAVDLPLVGRTVERSAAPELQAMFADQARLGAEWLVRR